MKTSVDVAIVGGGVNGCSLAYNLARLGCRNVAIYERSYLAAGSTGRCGAGVRAQWGTQLNCRLADASLKRFEHLEKLLDYPDIEFKQRGYLILAFSERELNQFRKNVALHATLGIPSRVVTPDEARRIVPHLAAPNLVGATFSPDDGHCNPFKVTDAYALAARRLGVEINTHTEVLSMRVEGNRVVGIETSRGPVACGAVVNTAGPYSAVVAAMAGVKLPVFSQRHQILVTEPVAPMQNPMVISFSLGVYCQQLPQGSFIMGIGDLREPKGFDTGHSWEFLADMAGRMNDLMPVLGRLRIVRQWSGCYNVTPDAQPILGSAGSPENFWLACGFSGHGFMLAPVVGQIMAQLILDREPAINVDRLDLGRFERGELVLEPSVV